MVKKKSKINKKLIVVLLILVLVLLCGLFIIKAKGSFFDSKPNNTDSTDINYNPPTEEEKRETEQFKSTELPSKISNETQQTSPSNAVTPIISSWGQSQDGTVEVSGYIPGIYEDGGKCTIILEKDGSTITQEQTSTKDAKVTICGVISVPRQKIQPGTWKISLNYSSNDSTGTSTQNITLDVQ